MKHGPKILLILAVAALVFCLAWPLFRIYGTYKNGQETAKNAFTELRRQAINTVLSLEDVSSEEWRNKASLAWDSQKVLYAILIKESGGEIIYAKPSSSPYYKRSPDGLFFESPKISTISFKGSLSGSMSLEALYVTLSQEDIFYPLRDAAIMFAAFLSLIAAGIIVNSGSKHAEKERINIDEDLHPKKLMQKAGEASLYHEELEEAEAELQEVEESGPKEAGDGQKSRERTAEPENELKSTDKAQVSKYLTSTDLSNAAINGPRGLFDPETGLGWEAYLRDRLSEELKRSASFEQDLSLLICSMDSSSRGDVDFNIFASKIQQYFSFKDMTFLFGDKGTASILPNMDVDHALRMCEELQNKLLDIFKGEVSFFGLSSRAGRLVDADRIIGEALAALNKAKKDNSSRILAFKPDPDRFRAYLSDVDVNEQ